MKSQLFETIVSDGVPRRAFLFMPFAFAGLMAVGARKERTPPDASQDGTGKEVTIVLFSDDGERKATVKVKKVAMSDAEWKKILEPEEFEVTRKAGTEIRVPRKTKLSRTVGAQIPTGFDPTVFGISADMATPFFGSRQ